MSLRSELEEKPSKWTRGRVIRIIAIAVALGIAAGVGVQQRVWTRVTRVLASADEEPIPTQRLEKVAFRLEVPATGEIIGLQSVPVPTPSTRSGGGLRIAWLIPE